jgi:glucose-1-phosphate cytidylyltransferase
MTTSFPPGRFGAITIKDDQVLSFKEKPKGDGALINAGYFILSPKVLNRIIDDQTTWEQEPLMSLANDGELMSYQHSGFWQPMDTLYDKMRLEELWNENKAPWKIW